VTAFIKTVSALGSFVLAMILFPEVQKKAQSAIDNTVGKSRLPELSDRGTAPYLEALFYELLRWKPIAPLGESVQPMIATAGRQPYARGL
jgi:cytochrome P450